jgi:hypothetical protein
MDGGELPRDEATACMELAGNCIKASSTAQGNILVSPIAL